MAGADRYATAVALQEDERLGEGFAVEEAGLARGDDFADALVATPPVLLTPPHRLPDVVRDFLDGRSDQVRRIDVFGGDAAVSPAVAEQARQAAQNVANDPRP